MGDYGEYKKLLCRELKKRIIAAGGKGVRVNGGRGTAWGWIEVWGAKYSMFTKRQRKAVEKVCKSPAGGNCWVGQLKEVGGVLGIPSPA
ncbi:MAG: hypothetical protein KAR06_02770 [Deltaproteobacteria bacterium]|nr:hypothetical protein [Deltaproteobacteria bacterium]